MNLDEVIISANTGADAIKKAPIVDFDTGIKCLRIGDVSQKREYSEWGFTNTTGAVYKQYKLAINDIIVARTGQTIGVNCLIEDEVRSVYNNGLIRIKANQEKIIPRYLWYLISGKACQNYIQSIAYGTSTQPNMKIKDLLGFTFHYQSLSIQRKIVDIINTFDERIRTIKRINKNLLQQLSTIYQEMYPYSPSDDLPEGWRCVLIGSICDSISIKPNLKKEQLIFLNTGDIDNGQFLHSDYSLVRDMPGQAKKSIKTGDILYSEIRPINRHFAFVNFPADDYVVSTKLMVIRTHGFDSRRLYHYLTTQEVIETLQLEAESRSGTFPQIRFENIQRLPIIIAPPEQEEKFVCLLHKYYKTIDNNTVEGKKLSILRDMMLPKLMSGELDVSEVDL